MKRRKRIHLRCRRGQKEKGSKTGLKRGSAYNMRIEI